MEILEIQNTHEVRPLFKAIAFEKRVLPSIIMVFASTKGILLLIVNVILMSIVISTNWIDRKEKARTQNFSQQRRTVSSNAAAVSSVFTPD
jgi:hypothetical protein